MEELQAKHRTEQRHLQARITQKKKNVTKKTRKGVNDECKKLQEELEERQKREIAELDGESTDAPAENLENLSLNDEEGPNHISEAKRSANGEPNSSPPNKGPSSLSNSDTVPQGKKPNRQKARLARRAAEQAAQSAIAAEEAAKQKDHRGNERDNMDAEFKRLRLEEVEINPDGHCLYSSIACQLDELGLGLKPDPSRIILSSSTRNRLDTVASPKHDGYRAVRGVTADYIQQHQQDFQPFMEEQDQNRFDNYINTIRNTAEWGGQLELQAIARAYGVDINVLQGDSRIEKIESGDTQSLDGDEKDKRKIWLAYYKHTYGLGEHYNALMQKS